MARVELLKSASSLMDIPRLVGIHGFAWAVPQNVRFRSGSYLFRAGAEQVRQFAPGISSGLAFARDGIHAPELLTDRRIISARSEERRVGKECRSRWSP